MGTQNIHLKAVLDKKGKERLSENSESSDKSSEKMSCGLAKASNRCVSNMKVNSS